MKIHLIEHTQDENGCVLRLAAASSVLYLTETTFRLYHCTLCGKVDPLLGGMARHAEDQCVSRYNIVLNSIKINL